MKKFYLLLILLGTIPCFSQVFFNEIHYDNSDLDVNEGFEIAGPEGLDLNGFSVVLYNGSGNIVYDTVNLSGILTNQQNGFGAKWFGYVGLQNGSSDGLALISPGGIVLQFLSYEGVLTAADGPAIGMTSIDIGISQNGSAIGQSLQLTNSGWLLQSSTYGNPNTGQTTLSSVLQSSLLFTGFVNGPNSLLPQAIELYALNDILDLSIYKIATADGTIVGFTFPSDAASSGDYIYISLENTEFNNFFGFSSDYILPSPIANGAIGDIELLMNDTVVDIFSETWSSYLNNWYYRNDDAGPNPLYMSSEWTMGGNPALDGSTNSGSTDPFPIGTYSKTASVHKNSIEGFSIYPNPVNSGSFKIVSANNESKSVQVYNTLGKQVLIKNVQRNENIDVSNLNAGIYILKVEEEGKIATRKLVIE